MRLPNDPRPKTNGGSSTLLVVLVIVSFFVVVALMVRSSFTASDEGREKGAQEGAVDSSFQVFETFDSITENVSGHRPAEKAVPIPKEPAPPAPALPMHLTDRPPQKAAVPETGPTLIPTKADGNALPLAASTGALNAPHQEIESLSPDGVIWPGEREGAEKTTGDKNEIHRPAPNGKRVPETVVEHILPDSGMAPSAGAPVFVRENRGPAASVQLAAGQDAPARPLPVADADADAERQLVARALGKDPVNRLSPPLFSLGQGKFPMEQFNLRLKLTDPNPRKVSRVLYSLDSTRWKLYEGSEIIVPPGTTVSAYCESLDPDWRNSPEESRDYLVDVRKLEAPQISASSPSFDKQANRRILISIQNPNNLATSRIEYRTDGGLWHPYSVPFALDADQHWVAGVRVEARAVATQGAPRPEDSDAVAMEFGRPETRVLASVRSEATAIDPRAVDLGMPVTTHGYSERLPGVGEGALTESPSAGERFVMGNFETYRRNAVSSAWSGTVVGPESLVIPAIGAAAPASGLPQTLLHAAGGTPPGSVSEGAGDFDLFESAIAAEALPTELVLEPGKH